MLVKYDDTKGIFNITMDYVEAACWADDYALHMNEDLPYHPVNLEMIRQMNAMFGAAHGQDICQEIGPVLQKFPQEEVPR